MPSSSASNNGSVKAEELPYQFSDECCAVCGMPMPVQTGRGRLSERHKHCRTLGKVLAWLESTVGDTAPYLDAQARVRIQRQFDAILAQMEDYPFRGKEKWIEKILDK